MLGIIVLPGLIIIILTALVQWMLSTQLTRLREKGMHRLDQRVQLIKDILSGMKVIKCFAWEDVFSERVGQVREEELKYARLTLMLSFAVQYAGVIIPVFATAVTFIVAIALMGRRLDPATIFGALALFNSFRIPLIKTPTTLVLLVEAKVSLDRIHKFITSPDLAARSNPPLGISGVSSSSCTATRLTGAFDTSVSHAIKMHKATFTWDVTHASSFSLNNIDLTIKRGDLVMIVGQVGSGKSSLLNAILGEMPNPSGSSSIDGQIAYCPQTPWIQNISARDNILFGSPFEETRYRKVIQACALDPDFEILPGMCDACDTFYHWHS